MSDPYWSQEPGIRQGIPPAQLMAEAKRLIAEIEEANPHLKQAPSGAAELRTGQALTVLSREQLEDQIKLWKQQCDQFREGILYRENELGVIRNERDALAIKAERLEARLRARRESAVKRSGYTPSVYGSIGTFNPYPNQPVEVSQKDPRDWSAELDQFTAEAVPSFTPRKSPGEDHWFTRFTDHPVTRFAAFATANVGFAVWLFLHH